MKIELRLNKENGIELTALVGDIFVSDGENSFTEKNVYLDSWLCSLVEGLLILKKGKNVIIDLIEESYNIEFLLEGKKIIISIPGKSILIDEIALFEKELKSKVISFLEEINVFEMDIKEQTLKFLDDFVYNRININTEFVQPIVKEWNPI
jgi:hypothetical protein